MANFRNRTRVVYFRVSEDEFQQYRDLCQRHGARNVSDLVRSAIEIMIRHSESDFERDVAERLRQLQSSVERLNQAMAQIGSERLA